MERETRFDVTARSWKTPTGERRASLEEAARGSITTWRPPDGVRYPAIEEHAKALFGSDLGTAMFGTGDDSAAGARLRTLERMGYKHKSDSPADEARQRMIQRREKR